MCNEHLSVAQQPIPFDYVDGGTGQEVKADDPFSQFGAVSAVGRSHWSRPWKEALLLHVCIHVLSNSVIFDVLFNVYLSGHMYEFLPHV